MDEQPFWEIAKQLGVETYSFSKTLLINKGLNNEISIATFPTVLLANISDIPSHSVIPIVMLDE